MIPHTPNALVCRDKSMSYGSTMNGQDTEAHRDYGSVLNFQCHLLKRARLASLRLEIPKPLLDLGDSIVR